MDRPSIIHKDAANQRLRPNWTDYAEERSRFSWALARLSLQGLPGGGLNMGFEAVDRHAAGTLRYHTALRFVSRDAPARYALDLHPHDRYWCTADPGWVTGTSYGIIAPLLQGVTSLVDREEFDAERWYTLLSREHVSVWYTAPTAFAC